MLPTGYGTEGIAKQVKAISDARAEAAARKFVPGVQKVYGIRMPMLNAIVAEVKKNATHRLFCLYGKAERSKKKSLQQNWLAGFRRSSQVMRCRWWSAFLQKYTNGSFAIPWACKA